MNNQKGFLVFDFIFAFMVVFSMSALLLITNFSLSMMEVVQYTTFASSRSYFEADVSEQDQRDSATQKFDDLIQRDILSSLLRKNFFEIKAEHGDISSHFGANKNENLIGTKTDVKVLVFSKTLPFLGSAGEDKKFNTVVLSMLGREPSMQECMGAINRRGELIKKNYSLEGFKVNNFWDNGC